MIGVLPNPVDQVEVSVIMRALEPEVVDAVWAAVEALLPTPDDEHPLGCHRPRVPDQLCFRGILIRLVTGASWVDIEAILEHRVSDTTLRARRDEWIDAGVFDELSLKRSARSTGSSAAWSSSQGDTESTGDHNAPSAKKLEHGNKTTQPAVAVSERMQRLELVVSHRDPSDQLEEARHAVAGPMTSGDELDRWLDVKRRTVEAKTIESYEWVARKLLAAAKAEEPDFGVYLWVLAVTGCRRGEACALRWTALCDHHGVRRFLSTQ